MKHDISKSVVCLATAGALVCAGAWAGVERNEIQDDIIRVKVSEDNWQPDQFDEGLTIPAVFAGDSEIFLDGQAVEPVWDAAAEVTVPLSFGTVETALVKALYTDEYVYFRVRWADPTEDRLHHPWAWDEELGDYVAGPQVEDSLMFSFEAYCEWFPSFLAGYTFDFDAWHWMAGRTDPVGQALDLFGSMKDAPLSFNTRYDPRFDDDQWNLKFTEESEDMLHKPWDELDRQYMVWPVIDTVYFHAHPDGGRNQQFARSMAPAAGLPSSPLPVPQFEPLKLKGNAAEVQAKGNWDAGYWTVELSRKRFSEGGTSYDIQFDRLTQFSLHVFDGVERLDQSSESGRLWLEFLEKEPVPTARMASD